MASRQKSKNKGRRGWWRSEFYDCPEDPTNEHFNIFGTSVKAGKTKVACKRCWDETLVALVREEEVNVQAGVQDFPRTEDYLKSLSRL